MGKFIFTLTFSINCTNSSRLIRTLSMALFRISIISRGLMTLPIFCREARSWPPWVRKFDYPCIREILVITRSSTPQAYQCKITQATGIATQIQHGVFWRKIAWPPGLFRGRKTTKSQVRLNFKVFTDVVNRDRERAKALDRKQRRRISWEEKFENWRWENEKC